MGGSFADRRTDERKAHYNSAVDARLASNDFWRPRHRQVNAARELAATLPLQDCRRAVNCDTDQQHDAPTRRSNRVASFLGPCRCPGLDRGQRLGSLARTRDRAWRKAILTRVARQGASGLFVY